MRMRFYFFIILSTIFFMIDQFVKYWVRDTLYKNVFGTEIFRIGDFNIKFQYALNKGISFSMFGNDNQLPILFISSILVIILIFWLKRNKNIVSSVGISILIGGAIGNIYDRINIGGVIDFIKVSYAEYSFPTFNSADTFIFIGVMLILFEDVFAKKSKKV